MYDLKLSTDVPERPRRRSVPPVAIRSLLGLYDSTRLQVAVVAAMEIRNRKRPKSTILRKCPTSLMDRAPTSPYPVAPSKYLGAS